MGERMSLDDYKVLIGKAPVVTKRGKRSRHKELLGRYLLASKLDWQPEYPFKGPNWKRVRKFDYALPEILVAVEFEGGIFQPDGGHNFGPAYDDDAEKYNEAAILGWMVIRVTAKSVGDSRAFDMIERAVKARSRVAEI